MAKPYMRVRKRADGWSWRCAWCGRGNNHIGSWHNALYWARTHLIWIHDA